ncbi:integrase catalytic domain-containing protein [Trichonephila clavipes]|nr:integrase catalytic domain-containing protein [Trichonephila clavipes]
MCPQGRISTLMSDNATSFKGAAAELNHFIKLICNKNETLASYFASEAIQWKFIPPRSPNFGGMWEAGVKSFKPHLYRTLVNSKITFEEFETVIIQIEGILNSRPLVPLSDNINEYEVLTPGHFIIGRPISAIPEPAILDISDNRLSRWQYTTKCVQTIWKCWKNYYLNHLQQRNKWQFEKNNVAIGCLVLLKENDLPPCKWAMARILEVIYGTDEKLDRLFKALIGGKDIRRRDGVNCHRLYPIGLSSDIEKAFLQLSIIPEHRDYLRFFLPNVEESKIYRHCRVVFGICSSPFQLSACIDHLLENSPARFDDVTQKLKHSFYVDNCVTGVTDIKEQESFINKAIEVMAKGCFNLRGWESNVPGRYISRSSGVTSLLGLLWDLDQDTLKCNLNYSGEGEISKRNVLAMVHKIFDPLGILSPTTLLPKVLSQEAWKLKLKWDDPLPENIQKIFREWRDEIVYLEKVNIPRYAEINENSELHLFVDASKSSYGACVYIRTVTPLGVKIRLIRAKTRVAPLKTMTIPQLELMACCIGARLVHSVYAALDVPDLKIIAWSDSMVALWWLKNHGDWSVFVANRVNEINSLVPSQFWRHVPSQLNPADLLSRGISPRLFSDSLWWEGPSWLLEPPSNWPIDRLACETSEVEREKRKVRLCNLVAFEGEIPWYAIKFSNFQ